MAKITKNIVRHMSDLTKIPIPDGENKQLTEGFNKILDVIDNLLEIDTKGVEPTHQVTGMENVFREDALTDSKTLTQEQALANTKKKHNGYFVTDQILEED